jgi:hypothetical protein
MVLNPGSTSETINGLYKAEVIHRSGPWRSFEAVEFATLEWVDWFNHRRLLEPSATFPRQKPNLATDADDHRRHSRYYVMSPTWEAGRSDPPRSSVDQNGLTFDVTELFERVAKHANFGGLAAWNSAH